MKTWFLWRECSNILTYPMRLPLLLKTGSLAKTGHTEVLCRLTSGAQGLGIQSEEGRSSELFDLLEVEIHLSFKCFSG